MVGWYACALFRVQNKGFQAQKYSEKARKRGAKVGRHERSERERQRVEEKTRELSKMENEKELLRRLRVKAGGEGETCEREKHEQNKGWISSRIHLLVKSVLPVS